MKWLVLLIAIATNVLMWLIVISPTLVTWAQVVPDGIACGQCNAPDVRHALALAADAGRGQMSHPIQVAAKWVAGLGVLNILVVAYLIFGKGRHKGSTG